MGIRETINENPAVTGVVAAIACVAALGFLGMRYFHHNNPAPKIPTQAYYTEDDGKTWYLDDGKNVPPYTNKKGNDAVRAVLFKCSDGKVWVQRLEKYTPEVRQKIQAEIDQGQPPLPTQWHYDAEGRMVKKPLTGDWLIMKENAPENNTAYSEMLQPKCPDGSNPQPVSAEENAKP